MNIGNIVAAALGAAVGTVAGTLLGVIVGVLCGARCDGLEGRTVILNPELADALTAIVADEITVDDDDQGEGAGR